MKTAQTAPSLSSAATQLSHARLLAGARAAVAAARSPRDGQRAAIGHVRACLTHAGLLPKQPEVTAELLVSAAVACAEDLKDSGRPDAPARSAHAVLLGCCRAVLAADRDGELAPISYLQGYLEEIGQMPSPATSPQQCLAEPLIGGTSS